MKEKVLFTGMLVLVLAFGMTVMGCEPEPEESNGMKIIITGITWSSGYSGYSDDSVTLNLLDGTGYGVANGSGDISNNTATVIMDYDWKESGSYGILVFLNGWDNSGYPIPGPGEYYFTNGKTFAELGITSKPSVSNRGNLPKYNFTATDTTIEFSKFKLWE